MGAGKARRHSRMLRCDVALELLNSGKCCSTVSTDEWPLAQMNCVHVLLQVTVMLEKLPTGDALERLLLQMDGLVVLLHVTLLAEELGARGVGARDLLTKMHFAVMTDHVRLVHIGFATSVIFAWNPAHHGRLPIANIGRCTLLLPATALEVGIEEMLR